MPYDVMPEETVECGRCGEQTRMLGTKRCDRCWELEARIRSDPEIARAILMEDTTMMSVMADGREIEGLTNERMGCDFAWVGREGVVRIEAYGEPGQMAVTPWFRVFDVNGVKSRIAAEHVAVHYRRTRR